MTQESFIAVAIGAMIALFFGTLLVFGGYRFFLFLLPIWGFFFGFGLGAESVQALFGDAFLSTITSWVVGFVVAMIFAVLAYLFYFAAVALIAGSLGYALGVGFMEAIGLNLTVVDWIVGIALAVIFGIVVLVFNIQKWVIIAATSILGAGVIIATFVTLFGGPAAQYTQNPVRVALQASPWWTISFLILAILGIVAQFQSTRRFELDMYNRSSELIGQDPDAVKGPVSA
jgi:predicted outer membrane lipoprotein